MNKRKPFIVEFTGTPEAGKTTVIDILYKQLLEMGYKVKKYPESAENSPNFFPKDCLEEKLWINFDTAKHILEAPFLSDYDIIIFDRGALDRKFWLYLDSVYYPHIVSKTSPIEKIFGDYPPDFLIALCVSAEESIKRRGGEGRIVTKEFVSIYNRIFNYFINSIKINKLIISTDNKKVAEVVQAVKESILENLKGHS